MKLRAIKLYTGNEYSKINYFITYSKYIFSKWFWRRIFLKQPELYGVGLDFYNPKNEDELVLITGALRGKSKFLKKFIKEFESGNIILDLTDAEKIKSVYAH